MLSNRTSNFVIVFSSDYFFYCVNALHGVNLFNACSIFVMRITLQNMMQDQKAEISMRSHDKGAGKNKKLRVEISC